MTRRERLMATLLGQPVDRPAVNFYEIDGISQDPEDPDPFNIYNDPSWRPLIQLAWEKTDCIYRRKVRFGTTTIDPLIAGAHEEHVGERSGSRITILRLEACGRTLTRVSRRDRDINTEWVIEPLLKSREDVGAWLSSPTEPTVEECNVQEVLDCERVLGDRGIVMIETFDPIGAFSQFISMEDLLVMAVTERDLFRKALNRALQVLSPRIERIARALPGRLWRMYGPELASVPYLPPELFREYVAEYDVPLIRAIQKHGGIVRLHSHGRLRDILGFIASMGCDCLDPVEPPPQGDVELEYVRRNYGEQMVLFGNLEVSEIETLPTADFALKVEKALEQGTSGPGRGFVLMPSSSPYGRHLSAQTLRNYETMVERVESL